MPWNTVWQNPEVFLEYKDVSIIHIYKNDEIESGKRTNWYGFHEDASDDSEEYTFDIRDLPNYREKDRPANQESGAIESVIDWHQLLLEYYKNVMIAAIDQGILTSEGIEGNHWNQ